MYMLREPLRANLMRFLALLFFMGYGAYISSFGYAASVSDPVVRQSSIAYIKVNNAEPAQAAVQQSFVIATLVNGYFPTGTVQFYINGGYIASASVNSITAVTVPKMLGTYSSITVKYLGDKYNLASEKTVSLTPLKIVPSVEVTPSSATTAIRQDLPISVVIRGLQVTGKVDLIDETVSAQSSAYMRTTVSANGGNQITYNLVMAFDMPIGTHTIRASYSGDDNNLPGFARFTINVTKLGTSVQVTPATGSIAAGTMLTVKATVYGAAPSGSVTFYDRASDLVLGTAMLGSPYATSSNTIANAADAAALFAINLPVGPNTVDARYSGNERNLPSSTSFDINVTTSPLVSLIPALRFLQD